MPLDVLGRTRATLMRPTSAQPTLEGTGNLLNTHRDGGRLLQLLILNEEFLVSVIHQIALITSLPFVHTARRSYRLSNLVNNLNCCVPSSGLHCGKSHKPYHLEEGEGVTRFP